MFKVFKFNLFRKKNIFFLTRYSHSCEGRLQQRAQFIYIAALAYILAQSAQQSELQSWWRLMFGQLGFQQANHPHSGRSITSIIFLERCPAKNSKFLHQTFHVSCVRYSHTQPYAYTHALLSKTKLVCTNFVFCFSQI